eukprot:12733-Heterococcus_DN1.PRE.7
MTAAALAWCHRACIAELQRCSIAIQAQRYVAVSCHAYVLVAQSYMQTMCIAIDSRIACKRLASALDSYLCITCSKRLRNSSSEQLHKVANRCPALENTG